MNTIAFFNNKGGVGKTTLVYHLSWMFADLGIKVLAVDLDPQANLSGMFLPDEKIEALWPEGEHPNTVYGAIRPLFDGTGDVASPHVESISDKLYLLVGDLDLADSEDELGSQWPECLDRKPRAFRVLSTFWRAIEAAAVARQANLVLIDVGPNLGAINRAALICARHVVIPLAPDIFSLQGLKNLGPALRRWREQWRERRDRNPLPALSIPPGEMTPAGYIVLQHAVRLDRPVKAYLRWMGRIPGIYHRAVLDQMDTPSDLRVQDDPHRLAALKHYRSLMPLAQEARKPMFFLTSADGAIGGHAKAVQDCYRDFSDLAHSIAKRCGVALP